MQMDQTPPARNLHAANDKGISEHEESWRSKFPKLPILILGIVQIIFIIIIFFLEIASLALVAGYQPTGVGIWCAIPFLLAAILTIILVVKKDCSRLWATRVLIAQIILLIFTFILIGITGNYVSNGLLSSYYRYYLDERLTIVPYNTFETKYRVTQTQLAFGILLMFSGLTYIGFYIVITILALWVPYQTIDAAHLFVL